MGFLIGPLTGGALVSLVGVRLVFLGNAASFLASAALCGTVTGRFSAVREHRPEWNVLAGVRFLLRHRILRGIAIIYFGINLGIGITMVANVPLADSFQVGSFGYGALIAVWGGGSMLGALVARKLNSQSEPVGFIAACALVGVAATGVGASPWFSLVLLALVLMGLGDGIAAVASAGMLQRLVPDPVRSRVVGGLGSFVSIGLVCSYLVAAPVLSLLGARGSYVLGGVVALAPIPLLLRTFVRSHTERGSDQPTSEVDVV